MVQGVASPSGRRTLENPQALESYLRAADPPRWMLRLKEIDEGVKATREALAASRAELRERHPGDPEAFESAWEELLAGWRWDPELNELIEQHNDWFPVERQLPLDIRTRDYRLINGRSYRRPRVDTHWARVQFPPGSI